MNLLRKLWAWQRHGKRGRSYADESWKNDIHLIQRHMEAFPVNPLIAVVMPVYNPHLPYLRSAIESVQAQLYPYWELCIANDASTDQQVAPLIDEFCRLDSRIKVIHRITNGHISVATNTAFELVTAEFAALMDQDDLIHPTALYEVASILQNPDEIDIIFSDEDVVDRGNVRRPGYFKPDFSMELMLGHNMINHLGVYRTRLVRDVGGLRAGFEGSQDYDLVLRLLGKSHASRVRHIQSPIYHWRRGGVTESFSEKNMERCARLARQAIQDYLDEQGEGATVEPLEEVPTYSRVRRRLPQPAPLVSCIIPTRNRHELLAKCIAGLRFQTEYPALEIIIVDNESDEPETLELFRTLAAEDNRVRIVRQIGAFNFATLNNVAVREAKGTILALLNNDLEMVESDWLVEMVSLAVMEGVGAVGAKLYYPNGTLQHAGVVIGQHGVAGHSWRGEAGGTQGYFCNAMLTRAVSAVTAACLVVAKSKYLQVGGMDEVNLPVAYNDVDFCLRLVEHGYRNIWTPFAKLIHHESVSRGTDDTLEEQLRSEKEVRYFKSRWAKFITNDPFYNPNLSLRDGNFSLEKETRRAAPWRQLPSS